MWVGLDIIDEGVDRVLSGELQSSGAAESSAVPWSTRRSRSARRATSMLPGTYHKGGTTARVSVQGRRLDSRALSERVRPPRSSVDRWAPESRRRRPGGNTGTSTLDALA